MQPPQGTGPAEPPSHRTRRRAAQGAAALARRPVLLAAALAGAALAAPGLLAQEDARELVIEAPGGGTHRFTVELAATPDARARGLMFRERMNPDHGMLFDFRIEQPVAFWMKNTPLPLDILFIDRTGTVTRIAADTVPFSETPIPSGGPIRGVLEVNAGTAARLGIEPGAKVRHPIFADGGAG